jgi:hypothetical protein
VRSAADVRAVFELLEQGLPVTEISQRTGVGTSTVTRWKANGPPKASATAHSAQRPQECLYRSRVPARSYAYLLGMYLGDGFVARHRRGVGRLSISCCADYPLIIEECAAAMEAVLPNRVWRRSKQGCVDVSSYSKHWWCLLPQTGPGRKHTRPIELEPWQRSLVDEAPGQFLRGLVHSDGCRSLNTIRSSTARGTVVRPYARYSFSNRSDDIRRLFTDACDCLGIRWRQMNRWNVAISRRADVAAMDRIVGPKR